MFSNNLLIVDFPIQLHGQFQHLANLIEFNLISTNASSALSELSTTSNEENGTTIMIHYLEHPLQEIGYLSAELFKSNLHIAFCPALNVELEVILISSGFHGAISVDDAISHQIECIKKVQDGDISFDPKAVSKYILQRKRIPSSGNRAKILAVTTKKEQQILSLILHGLTNEEMAKELNISVNTVKMHVQNIYKKTKIKNRGQLFAFAAG
ncbi:response regulator transcription factor [Shewanella livingstonensis]|uniref:DNA-binding response regulator n=1 Tax=Shewanella livingstonensis TaxID=150120 RepID=A0A3G8LTB0_9GAMM|nr:LuxR C-terminal-related transcriptional regulator [Shewanella livingstonensis]AZG72112.1 DNA-binding response regulator [Shewanella livingstonensis]